MKYKYRIEIWEDDDIGETVYEQEGIPCRTVKSCLQAAHRTLLDWLKEEKQSSQM